MCLLQQHYEALENCLTVVPLWKGPYLARGVGGVERAVPWQGSPSSELLPGVGPWSTCTSKGSHDSMVGLGSCLTLVEVDGGWDMGKAVCTGLTDMMVSLDKVQGETC